MTQCSNKPFLWVLEQLTAIQAVGGLSGPTQKVEYFLCLATRLLQICPAPDLVLAMLRQDIHKYVRVAAMVVIRLIGNKRMVDEAVEIGLGDYRKVRVFGDKEELPAIVLANAAEGPLTGGRATQTAGAKRMRMGDSADADEKSTEVLRLEALASLKPPEYFILRMDEVTVKLFSLDGGNAAAAAEGGPCSFLGIPLPQMIEAPSLPPL